MTVSSTDNRIVLLVNGSITNFDYPFLAYTEDSIKVYLGTAEVVTGFTVTLASDFMGGTVSFTVAPPGPNTLTIARIEELDQETDLVPYDRFPSEVIERSFDKLTMICQQLSDTINRSLTSPINDPLGIQLTIPDLDTRKGKVLAFDGTTGELISSTFTLEELENAQQTAQQAVTDAQQAASDAQGYVNTAQIAATQSQGYRDQSQTYANNAGVNAAAAAASVNEIKNQGQPLGLPMWWPMRSSIPGGLIALDGHEISRATFPNLAAALDAGLLPVVSQATWTADPTQRGKYVAVSSPGMMRVPDFNGKTAGSLGAVFLRGDGALSAAVAGEIQRDALQNINASVTIASTDSTNTNGNPQGALAATSNGNGQGRNGGTVFNNFDYTFDASRVARTATETRPLNVTGCWVVRAYGVVTNVGSADAAQLASDYANLASRVTALESIGKPFTKEFVSSEQTITAGGLLNLTHGLGVKPKHATLSLKCVIADQGYSVGEETELGWGPQDVNFSYGANYTATDSIISVRIGAAGRGFIVINKTTGAVTDLIATANWRIVVRAWA